jgi:hypothetical protein
MTFREYAQLKRWFDAGLGVAADDWAEPVLIVKGYLAVTEAGPVLTEKALLHAKQLTDSTWFARRAGPSSIAATLTRDL